MLFNLADMKYERESTIQSKSVQREFGEIICRLSNRGVLISSITLESTP